MEHLIVPKAPKVMMELNKVWKILDNSPALRLVLYVSIISIFLFASGSFLGADSSSSGTSSSSSSSSLDNYSIPFCAADGWCGEESNKPTPRTVYSARSQKQFEEFMEFHNKLVNKASDFVISQSKKSPLVLLGDSITEAWVGTSYDGTDERFKGVPEILDTFATELGLNPLVLGLAGDQVQHLWWRCLNGELPVALLEDIPNVTYVILIGTNNLGSGMLPEPTSQGLLEFTEWLLKASEKARGSRVLLLELLPRGDNQRLKPLCPPRCHDGKPFHSFTYAVDKVNAKIKEAKTKLEETAGNKQRFATAKCDIPFLLKETDHENVPIINEALMPDKLHPNAGETTLPLPLIYTLLSHLFIIYSEQ